MEGYILVVDDDPDVRGLLVTALRLFGLTSQNAIDGQQALDLIRTQRPRAILLDLMMPTCNGFSTLTRIQQDRALRGIPVILMSGLSGNEALQHLPGVVGVMRKGEFSVEGLQRLLSRAGIASRGYAAA